MSNSSAPAGFVSHDSQQSRLKSFKARRAQRQNEARNHVFPIAGRAPEALARDIDLNTKANATLGVLAVFLAGLQAQLFSILPSEDHPRPPDVAIAVLFFAGIFLDIFATLFTILATTALNYVFSRPIANRFDLPEDDQKSSRARHWGHVASPGFVLGSVRQGMFAQLMSVICIGPGILCTIIGLQVYVWSHQPRPVAYVSTVVCALVIAALGFQWLWLLMTLVRFDDRRKDNVAFSMVAAGTSLARTGPFVRKAWGFDPDQRFQMKAPTAELQNPMDV